MGLKERIMKTLVTETDKALNVSFDILSSFACPIPIEFDEFLNLTEQLFIDITEDISIESPLYPSDKKELDPFGISKLEFSISQLSTSNTREQVNAPPLPGANLTP
jgi:hypothetical protein